MTNLPEITYQMGTVKVTVWKNNVEGNEFSTYSIKKSYKDKEGNWQDTTYLSENDLKNLSVILDKVAGDKVKYFQPQEKPQEQQPTITKTQI